MKSVEELEGLKREEIKKCSACSRGVMHDGGIQFYRVKLESYIVDFNAVNRAHGMEMMMGGHALLAHMMGPNEDLAKKVFEHTHTICSECAFKAHFTMLLEASEEESRKQNEKAEAEAQTAE